MSLKAFVVDGPVFAEPFLHERTVYVVVIDPGLIARVVGWIDVDALDPVRVAREQRFEGVQVIAMNDKSVIGARRIARATCVRFKRLIGNGEMVGVDVLFPFEFKGGHWLTSWGLQSLHRHNVI